ncbi:MAG TPA: ABC transporter permease [Chloroflexota bacterium]|nr:ABC transporter permease [Chloroflexota bacterium]
MTESLAARTAADSRVTGGVPWLSSAFRRYPAAVVGGVLVGIFLAIGIFGPSVVPYQPDAADLANVLSGPSAQHLFGTDELGRDLFSRVLAGARISIFIGCTAEVIAMGSGIPLGALAAYYTGWISDVILGVANVLLTFPTIILAITIISVIGLGISGVIIAAGIAMAPGVVRLTYGTVLSVKFEDYVLASRALGSSDGAIIARHLLPNSLSPLIVQATLGIGGTVLTAAGLGFLGLGVQPPDPEWGTMLSEASNYIMVAPYMAVFPGLAIAVLVLGFNLLGDGLSDAFDPRQRNRFHQ